MLNVPRCLNCRADLLVGAKFCVACGTGVSSRCPACQHVCGVVALHCPQCGVALEGAREMPGAERRQLTVVFCDLVGSTELSVRLDPEDTRDIILAYQQACTQVVTAYQGYISRYQGDGVLVYFGYPVAREDAAERAVRAGLEIVAAVAALGGGAGVRLNARVGIATGVVVVGDMIGTGSAREHAAVGETPNLAARLQGLAEPGTVVISESTRRLVGDLFEMRDLGSLMLKGFSEPVATWVVTAAERSRNRFEAAHPQPTSGLIGRGTETTLLSERQRLAWDGHGQVVLVSGEAGIGKSHLASWIGQQVAGTPHVRLQYQCSPYHRASALHPFVTQLAHAAGLQAGDDAPRRLDRLEALLRQADADVGAVAPLFASLLAIPFEDRYGALSVGSDQQRQRTLGAFLEQLVGLASHKPVLLVFEDVQWADPTSLELLDAAIARIATLPVLAVFTARPDFSSRWEGPTVTRLELNRLLPDEARALVARVSMPARLSEGVVHRIVERSDGVPLYVEELTKAVLEFGPGPVQPDPLWSDATMPSPSSAVPESLRDSLAERLDHLASVKEVAQIGAAIGRVFSHELLRAAYGGEPAELETALGQLEKGGLIASLKTAGEPAYRFRHALLQEAAYETLLKSRRRVIHQRIAQALEGEFRTLADNEPEVVAHHFTLAGTSDKAVEWWQAAGHWATSRAAYAEAASHLERAIALVEKTQPRPERRRTLLQLQVAYGQVMIASRGYASVESTEAFKKARVLAGEIEDATERYSVYHGLWASSHIRGDLAPMREMSEAFLLDVKDRAGTGEAGIADRIVGTTRAFEGRFLQAIGFLERALATYDAQRDRQLAYRFGQDAGVAAECYLALALWPVGQARRACEVADSAILHAAASGHPPTVAYGHAYKCIFEAVRGSPAAAAKNANALVDLSHERGMQWWLSSGIFFRGWTRWHGGDRDSGMADMKEGMDLCRQHGLAAAPILFEHLVASAEGEAGQFGRALERVDRALARIRRTGECWLEAEVLRLRGGLLARLDGARAAEAEAACRKAIEVAQGQGARAFELRALLDLARLRRGGLRDGPTLRSLKQACAGLEATPDFNELLDARVLLHSLSL